MVYLILAATVPGLAVVFGVDIRLAFGAAMVPGSAMDISSDLVLDLALGVAMVPLLVFRQASGVAFCCGPVKGSEERHELGFTWNKVY